MDSLGVASLSLVCVSCGSVTLTFLSIKDAQVTSEMVNISTKSELSTIFPSERDRHTDRLQQSIMWPSRSRAA